MSADERHKIARLQEKNDLLRAELAEYKAAFRSLVNTRIELAGFVQEVSPTREQLLVHVAGLREALWWAWVLGDYRLSGYGEHFETLLKVTE